MKNVAQKMNVMIAAVTLGSGLLFATPGFAQVKEDFKVKFVDQYTGAHIKAKGRLFVDFNGWTHVEKLKVDVKGEIPGFTVFSNGVAHIPTYFPGGPGSEPYYECPLDEASAGVEFRAEQEAELRRVSYRYADRALTVPEFGRGGGYAIPTTEVRKVIEAVNALSQFATLNDQAQYLLPIKVAAGHALALEYGRGGYSVQTGQALQALIAQVDFAKPYIEQEMELPGVYEWAIYLLSIKERLAQMTN